MMKKVKGSLSLEAVISFTIFISFMFLLLSIVKFSLVRITLSSATSETAKQIATAAYPLSYLIEAENSKNEKIDAYEEKMQLTEGISNKEIGDAATNLFNINSDEVSGAIDTITKIKDLISGGDNAANAGGSLIRGAVAGLEQKAGAYVACNIFNSCIDNSGISVNKDDVTLTIVKFPQSDFAYKQTGKSEGYTALGISNDSYSAEDVIIASEYRYDFALPFLPSFEIKMREAAVEHAWLYGGGNTITNREDDLDLSKLKELIFGDDPVYLGSMLTGNCYHKKSCSTIWHGTLMISREAAKKEGYDPCGKCHPDN